MEEVANVRVKMLGLTLFTKGEVEAEVEADDILSLIEVLKRRYPLFKERLCDPRTGRLYPGFEILVNGQPNVDEEHKLWDGDIVAIIPIFAGGGLVERAYNPVDTQFRG